jgi:iron complex transport system ATP-binding protein
MRGGKVDATGRPADVVTAARVEEVFGLEAQVIHDPVSGTPLVVPIGRHHRPSAHPHAQGA